MLTYEALIDQARARMMPTDKVRGILREYLQILILKELSRSDAKNRLYFTGGTYLRLVHGLKRFSEDLDFNTSAITEKEFEAIIEKIKTELRRSGIDSDASFEHWGNIYAAQLKFSTVEKMYNVVSKYSGKEGIVIKIETNNPRWRIKEETQVISGFGELYPYVCTDKGALFADKVDALSKKNRGRHIYDIMYMLSNNYPIDKDVLKSLGIKDDPLKVIAGRIKGYAKTELKKQAETLRPFLFDEKDADLLINAHFIIPHLLEKYTGKK